MKIHKCENRLFECRVKINADKIRMIARLEKEFKIMKSEIMESLNFGKIGED